MQPDLPHRLKALRQLVGLMSADALADELHAHGYDRNLGEKTIRLIEQGRRPADAKDLDAIARTCGVPIEWFTADFSRLAEISEDPRQAIARELAAAVERSETQQAGTGAARPPRAAEGPAR